MRRALTGFLVTMALCGSVMAGTFSNGLERLVAGKAPSESITVLLSMTQQADIAALDAELSARKATLAERHGLVVGTLMSTATKSQAAIMAELTSLKAAGKVNGYTPYWVTNAIVVNAPISTLRQLAARPDVQVVEPNLEVEPILPIEPIKPSEVTGPFGSRTPEPGLTAVNADDVWNILSVTGAGALVGSIDTGVDGTHPALTSRWRGNNGHPVSECWLDAAGLGHPNPTDTHGHGTHTTGTMVGGAPGDEVGVAPGAQWIASNCINMGTGAAFDNAVIASFQFMADPDGNPGTVDDVPDVVQNSWGVNEGFSGYFDCDSRWWAAIDNCEASGVCVTWSAGNEGPGGTSLRSPADRALTIYNCFSVGATIATAPYTIADFSSRGPSGCGGAFAMKPEVSAPGVNTRSSYPGGGYTQMSGTSMAGPHVAGVVALMRSANPNVDVSTIKQILMDTAVDLGAVGEDNTYGHGIVDAYEAVLAVMSGYGTLSGTVTDAATMLPLAGVLVDNTAGPQQTNTNGSGAYSMMFPEGTYSVSYSAFGYTAQTYSVSIVADATTTRNVSLSPAPSAILSGYVYGPDTNPIVGAIIDFTNAPVADVITGAGGYYSVTIPTGYTYNLTASATGVGSQSQSIVFNAASTLDFNLPINPQFLPSGPDTYGYRIFDSNDTGGVPFSYTDISGTGTALVLSDDSYSTVTVPFSFIYYGATFSQLSVGSNGFATCGATGNTSFSNGPLPALNGTVCGMWDDLNPSSGGTVYTQALADRFIVQWNNVSYFGGGGAVEFQIVLLNPANYPSQTGDAQWIVYYSSGDRASHTTGMTSTSGTHYLQYVANSVYDVNASPMTSPIALLITTNENGFGPVSYPEVAVSPTSLSKTLAPGGTDTDLVTVSNTGEGNLSWNASVTTFSAASTVPYLEVAKGQVDPRPGQVSRDAGGPDAYGYSWKDSNEPGGPAYSWFDISGFGNTVGTGDDGNFGPFPLGFTFNYYGTDFSALRITTNGFVSFTSTSAAYTNQGIPTTFEPNNMVAAFWDDLYASSIDMIKYYADGANQRFIVQYTAIPLLYDSAALQTFQIILHADGRIVYQYHTVANVVGCTVGIENSTGTDGLQVVFNAAYLANSMAIEFATTTPWLAVAPASGSVIPGGSGTFNVLYDATEIPYGTFTGQVNFTCNDPASPSITIPVTMIVSGVDSTPPVITHTALGNTENTAGPYVVSANVTDLSGIASVTLSYRLNGGAWVNAGMTGGPVYAANIPGQPFGTAVDYYITAVDNSANNNTATTATYSFNVVDNSLPVITHTPLINTQDTVGPYTVNANITDNTTVTATVSYRANAGAWTNIGMTGGPAFTANIPGPRPIGTVIDYYITAVDGSPNQNTSQTPQYTFTILAPTGLEYCQNYETQDLGDWTSQNFSAGNEWGSGYFGAPQEYTAYIQYSSTSQEDHAGMISPVFDCSGQGTVSLDFWMQLRYGYSTYWTDAFVRGSTDGGVTYPHLITEWHAGPADDDLVVEGSFSYDITSWAAGQSNVKIMFEYHDLYDWWWHVDDVCVTGTLAVVPIDPVDLNITYLGAGTAQLSWAPVPNATSYDVYSATSMNGPYTFLVNKITTSHNVSTGAGQTRVYHVVTRMDAAAASAVTRPNPVARPLTEAERLMKK